MYTHVPGRARQRRNETLLHSGGIAGPEAAEAVGIAAGAEAAVPPDIAVAATAGPLAAASTRTIHRILHQAITERCTSDNSYCYSLGLLYDDLTLLIGIVSKIMVAEIGP